MSRYQDELIELAKKFDSQTDSKGKFLERVIILLNDYSEKLGFSKDRHSSKSIVRSAFEICRLCKSKRL